MKHIEIISASRDDASALCDIFLSHITAHPEYISHGEVQMGVGVTQYSGGFISKPSPDARQKWMNYIYANFDDSASNIVLKAVPNSGADDSIPGSASEQEIAGFCVAQITDDGDEPFGMLCDVLVKEEYRGRGVGTALVNRAIEWLRSKGIKDIYLESGLNNHAAHEYFERHGFQPISHIFKLA